MKGDRFLTCENVSIHAPHAGSDALRAIRDCLVHVSIHAPHAGSDKTGDKSLASSPMFQSTLPTRGATVSGCTREILFTFQSTLPTRGATGVSMIRWISRLFQSTLPTRGATHQGRETGDAAAVSIHAPHAGSDASSTRTPPTLSGFNPRSPRGERPQTQARSLGRESRGFNPRSPRGERLFGQIFKQALHGFNPRSPRGERHKRMMPYVGIVVSIHAPHAGSDLHLGLVIPVAEVSIHAPHAGSDR